MKTNHRRGFVAKYVKSGPEGTSKASGVGYYNSAHHGFQRAKAAVKKSYNRKTRRTLKQKISTGKHEP